MRSARWALLGVLVGAGICLTATLTAIGTALALAFAEDLDDTDPLTP